MKKKIRDVHINDIIIGTDSLPHKVVDETDIFTPQRMFLLKFSNGEVRCSDTHKWKYWINKVDFDTETLNIFLNKDFFILNDCLFGVEKHNIKLLGIEEIEPELVKCITVDSIDHQFLGYTNENQEIFLSNCGWRAFCGKATESGASLVALDNTLATTIDNTYPGAGIIQSAGVPTFCRFFFSKFEDLEDYYEKRGLNNLGYISEDIEEESLESLSGEIEIDTNTDKVEFEFEDEKAEIDKRKDQKWENI